MAISKVVYGESTLIDLTSDTVSEDNLLEGFTAHKANGDPVVGTVVFSTCYTGTEEPDSSLGVDGDIYIMY